MEDNAIGFRFFFGLCILSPCFSHVYHVINERKSWTDAQSYCREKYTDLVTINSREDMARVKNILRNKSDEFWIGLYGDINNWMWSLEKDGFSEQGQANLIWNSGEPNNHNNNFMCGDIAPFAGWSDYGCNAERPFVCYHDSAPNYIYVRTPMNWTNAQLYCRANYTDLASVRNVSENKEINKLVVTYAWIGLYKESWRWSDGQRLRMTSFSNWSPGQSVQVENSCVTTTSSIWNIRLCSSSYPFICSGPVIERKVVKVTVSKSNPSLDLEEMQKTILQQLSNTLYGLGEVKLKWIKQSDGKTFHSEKKEKKKKD